MLLIYQTTDTELILIRMGSHSELFWLNLYLVQSLRCLHTKTMKTLSLLLALASPLFAEGKKFTLTARASEIDKHTKEHPEIDYVLKRKGKPTDNQFTSVDTRVKASG